MPAPPGGSARQSFGGLFSPQRTRTCASRQPPPSSPPSSHAGGESSPDRTAAAGAGALRDQLHAGHTGARGHSRPHAAYRPRRAEERYRRLLRKRNVPQTNSDVSPAPSVPDATLLCSSSQANFCSGISSYKVQWKFKPDWRIGGVCRLASTHETTLTQGGEPGKQGSASAPERREGKAPRAGDLGHRLSASLVPGRVDLVVLGRGLALVAAHPNGLGGGRRHPWTWRCARPAARSSCRCTTRARRFRRK